MATALATVVHSLTEPIVGKSLDGVIRSWNVGAELLYGYSAAEAIGQPISMLAPPDRQDEVDGILERLAGGESVQQLETIRRHKDGHELSVLLTVEPVRDRHGAIVSAIAITHDISEYKRREMHQRFLAEAGRALAGSLDYEQTLQQVVRLPVPDLADWCTLEILDREGRLRQAAVAHTDPGREALLERVRQRPPLGLEPSPSAAGPAPARTFTVNIESRTLEAAGYEGRELEALRELSPRSAIVAPLPARGRVTGVMLLARSSEKGCYDESERRVAEDLASRAGLALDQAAFHAAAESIRREAEHAAARTKRLQWATAAFSEAATAAEVAEVLVGQGAAAVEADAAFVRLLSPDGTRLELAASLGFADEFIGTHRSLPVDSPFPGADAVRDGQARWFESSESVIEAYPQFAAAAADRGAIALLPLRLAKATIGVIALSFAEQRRFTQEDRELLRTLGTLCAHALQRAALYDSEQQARRQADQAVERTTRLQMITAALGTAVTPAQVAEVVIGQALAALGATAGIVALLSDDRQTFSTLGAINNRGEPVATWASFPADAPLPIPDAVRTGESVVFETIEERFRRYPELSTVKRFSGDGALLALPLVVKGRALGGLGLGFAEPRRFDEDELRYIETVAEQCAQALERARLYEQELEARNAAEEGRRRLGALLVDLDAERGRLAQLVERLHEGVVSVRRDGTVALANSTARAFMTGTGLESGEALPERWLGFPLRAFAAGLFEGEARLEAEVGAPGEDESYSLTGLPADGAETVLLVVSDRSERERAERAEREFVANAAHELRTPLASISVAIEALQAGAKEVAQERDVFLADIEQESARLNRLARSLLVLARVQSHRDEPGRTPIELRPLLEEVLAGLERKEAVELVLEVAPDAVVSTNRELLEHAVLNLATNALRYTERGTVWVSAAVRPDGSAAIEVRDTGPGIPVRDQARLFERFARLRSSEPGGFGLGLAITRQAVDALGGRLALRSAPGAGTTVEITLPAAVKSRVR